jgi:hypothetical protein
MDDMIGRHINCTALQDKGKERRFDHIWSFSVFLMYYGDGGGLLIDAPIAMTF